MTTDTSLEAYIEINENGKLTTQEAIILSYLNDKRNATRRVIARDLHMETSTVSARVNSLKQKHKVIDKEVVKCPISKKRVYLVAVA